MEEETSLSDRNKRFWKNQWAVLTEEGQVLRCDLETYCNGLRQGAHRHRIIRQEYLPDGYWLSTVFLGLDHQYDPGGLPLWFESMIFAPADGSTSSITGQLSEHGESIYVSRYRTMEEALAGHAEAKQWFLNSQGPECT